MSALFQCKPKPSYLKPEDAEAPRKPEYKLIDADTIDELEKKINALLADGWFPAGGVQVILDRHNDCQGMAVVEWVFHQAMIKTS